MRRPAAAIFCDFDGTVSQRDVGYYLFHHFSGGKNDALLPDWKAGRLSTRDCLRLETEMVKAAAEDIMAFVDRFELDPTFAPFVRRCRDADLPVRVVSEGMDFYIRRLLAGAGLDGLTVLSNRGILENETIRIEFPYTAKTCEGCGNCKAQRMKEYRLEAGAADRVVFVGDGYSDACAASEADIVFAKKDLQQYCQDEGISYYSFSDFDDITAQLAGRGFLTPR
jgi:2,3-diketo-5-methylthio-1-phosphopentane phosphatase